LHMSVPRPPSRESLGVASPAFSESLPPPPTSVSSPAKPPRMTLHANLRSGRHETWFRPRSRFPRSGRFRPRSRFPRPGRVHGPWLFHASGKPSLVLIRCKHPYPGRRSSQTLLRRVWFGLPLQRGTCRSPSHRRKCRLRSYCRHMHGRRARPQRRRLSRRIPRRLRELCRRAGL
jgi:hypothetical protein